MQRALAGLILFLCFSGRLTAMDNPAVPASAEAPSPAPQTVVDTQAIVTVLGYHRLCAEVRRPDTEITPKDFEAQMQQVKDSGATVISLDDFLAWRRGEKNIPRRSVIITFDDGWNSTYDLAWPILKKFGYPFTLFVYTDYIKGGPKSGGGSLSWEQLAELRDAGASIQSHSISHRDLRGRRRAGTREYEEWLWQEVLGSMKLLERELGISVKAFALPYGLRDDHVTEAARLAGYEAIFTIYGQKITYASPLDSLGRYIIAADKPKLFAEAIHFLDLPATVGGRSGPGAPAAPLVFKVDPAKAEVQPADGSVISDKFPVLQANLAAFGSVAPKSVSMRISGLGPVPASYDPETRIARYKILGLRGGEYTVIVSAKVGDQKVETRWTFRHTGGR